MINLKFFLVSYDRLTDRVIEDLDSNEIKSIVSYNIQKSVQKNITNKVSVINEWELDWNDYSFQKKQYYEYSSIVHLTKNPVLLEGLTHVGILHYDVKFNKNSINDIKNQLTSNSDKIFYQKIRGLENLYFSKYELDNICKFMSERLDMVIDSNFIWNNGWVSEALSLVPVEIFTKFGLFLSTYHNEIEDILVSNKWGIMNYVNHRVCGLVERMWGFYLVSLNKEMVKLNIEHEWDFYTHKHQTEENWIKK